MRILLLISIMMFPIGCEEPSGPRIYEPGIAYMQDSRTHLCFAISQTTHFYFVHSHVPCTE